MRLKASTLKSLVLYNYRYLFAYAVVFIFALYFLAWRLGSIAPGLSQPELQTAAQNSSLSAFFNLPIYPLHSLLQWASLNLLGVSSISIRLPSVIIAGITVIILYSLLKKWFGKVTSLISVALLLSADWFLFIARLGTGSIEFSLWLALMVFSLMKLISKKPNWLLGYALASAMLLFCPYGIYAVVTSTVCLFVCVMFRKRAAEASNPVKVLSLFIILSSVALIAVLSIKDIQFIKALTGFADTPTPYEYFKNLVINSSGVVMLWPDNNPLLGPSGIFLIRFFELVFMLFGLIMLSITRVNRLNIVVIANAIVLALASGLSSDSRGGSLLIVPAAVFMTAGLRHFIHRWERTFPKNPYAKVLLYIPLVIMVITTATLHFQSYFVLWPSQTATRVVFTDDYALLKKELADPGSCVVAGASKEIQKLIAIDKVNCQTSFKEQRYVLEAQNDSRVISRKPANLLDSYKVTSLNSSAAKDNTRWLVYGAN